MRIWLKQGEPGALPVVSLEMTHPSQRDFFDYLLNYLTTNEMEKQMTIRIGDQVVIFYSPAEGREGMEHFMLPAMHSREPWQEADWHLKLLGECDEEECDG